MYRKIFCFVAIALLWSSTILAQQKELDAGIKYEINNITVAGAQSYNDQTVIAFTGLKKGERIFIPGERLSEVTKKLWEQNLFSDIAIYVTKIDGDLADLEIYIVELPKLDEITIVGDGIRKAMTKEILKETELKSGLKITKNFSSVLIGRPYQANLSDLFFVNKELLVYKMKSVKLLLVFVICQFSDHAILQGTAAAKTCGNAKFSLKTNF